MVIISHVAAQPLGMPSHMTIGSLPCQSHVDLICLEAILGACRALKMDADGGGVMMEPPPPELHSSILRAAGLNPKQRRAALAYRNHLLSRMGATLQQRRDISLQLLRTLGTQLPPDKQVTHHLGKHMHIEAVYSQAASFA